MHPSAHDKDRHSALATGVMKETVYTRDSMRQQSWRIWGSMARGLIQSRGLIWRLVLRDISARYRQSALGYLWAIFPPIVTVGIFAFLTRSHTLPIGEPSLPYVVYALWSLGVWQLFAGCLTACTNSLVSAGPLVTKVNFSKDALVTAAIGQPLLDFLIRLVPVALVFVWQDVTPKWQSVFVPLTLIPAVLLAMGLGFILSIVNLVLRDVSSGLTIVLTFGIFLAPVLYPPPAVWPLVLINIVNPFSPLLIASQDLIAYGFLTMPEAFVFSCLFCVLIFLLGWRLFHLMMPRISAHA